MTVAGLTFAQMNERANVGVIRVQAGAGLVAASLH